jgi:hypothetical protein
MWHDSSATLLPHLRQSAFNTNADICPAPVIYEYTP